MKIHIISRTPWNEPHRLRQQIAMLVAAKHSVIYHEPIRSNSNTREKIPNISFKSFFFIEKFASLPPIWAINSLLLYFYFKNSLSKNDVLINFLPEAAIIPKQLNINIISVINDDFALMAPKITARWVVFLLKKMASTSTATLYVSKKLKEKYPSKNGHIFYPWSDKIEGINEYSSSKRNIILYWGFISSHLNFLEIEDMCRQITNSNSNLEIHLIGPTCIKSEKIIGNLTSKYNCIKYYSPRNLESINTESVLFGIELLSSNFKNSNVVEMPNKAPRLISYGIPLVYSGCNLLPYSFLIKYNNNLEDTVKFIRQNWNNISKSIDNYLTKNNTIARLNLIEDLINKK